MDRTGDVQADQPQLISRHVVHGEVAADSDARIDRRRVRKAPGNPDRLIQLLDATEGRRTTRTGTARMPCSAKDPATEGLVHIHRHFHVTHNHSEMSGGFEHLSSAHEHEHNHAPVRHAHVPHQDFEQEHAGEAHVYDHDQPTASRANR